MFYVSMKIFADINFERNVKESKLAAFEWENQIFSRTGTVKTLKFKLNIQKKAMQIEN